MDWNKYFVCAACGHLFIKGWSEEEAETELARSFPGFEKSECVMICGGCYTETMGYYINPKSGKRNR
jgi:hypothetical protein